MVVTCATCPKKIRLRQDNRPEGEAQCRPCLNATFAASGLPRRTRACDCGKKIRGAGECMACSRRDQHILTDLDEQARSATCSQCGAVQIRRVGRGWRCWTALTVGYSASVRRRTEAKEKFRQRMLAQQDHRCAICGMKIKGFGGKDADSARIDHDHTTGMIRAALCNGCNVGLGGFRESPAALRAAAEYLEYHVSTPGAVLYVDYNGGRLGIRERESTILLP